MPILQNVVVTDRATTPVNLTLTPKGRPDGVAVVGASADGSSVGMTKLTISHRKTADKWKTRLVFSAPVVVSETINGVASLRELRQHYADVTFTFSATSTEAERNNFVGQFSSLFMTTKALTHDVLVKGEEVY